MRYRPTTAGLVTVACLAAAGCGDGGQDAGEGGVQAAPATPAIEQPRVWDESEIMRLAGVTTSEDGLEYILESNPDCTASVLMTTRGMVEMYAGAGDTVATNPDGTAGAKVGGAERATCMREWTEALENVQ